MLHEEVSEVTHVEVKFKNEKPAITFDYLIIATGSSYPFPCNQFSLF